jgi:hypothetical protein
VQIVNFLDVAGDHENFLRGKVLLELADYNRACKKTSREKSCATGKLQLSSRLDMFAPRNLRRASSMKPEKRMKRPCFVTD